MGGGSSVLSSELSKCLTQPSLEKFHQLQAECELKEMDPMEMYVYLTARYEELILNEREAVRVLSDGLPSPIHEKAEHAKPKASSGRPPMHGDHHHNATDHHHYSKLEEDYLTKDIMTEYEDSQDFEVNALYDPYVESVVGRVFNVVDDPQVQSVVKLLLAEGGCSTQSSFVIGSSFIRQETDGLECSVCRMKFDDRRSLDTHLAHSPIHSVNVRIRQEVFRSTLLEAERLAKLAQSTISKLIPHTSSSEAGTEGNAKTLWKKAVNKVICSRLKAQFLPLLEQICDTPPGVKMLYAGSKCFYKSKATFDLHIYLHTALDIVEVVPHFLPNKKQQKHEGVEAHPRIYLDQRVLVPLVLGVDRSESRLSMRSNATTSIMPSSSIVSGATSRMVAIASSKADADPGLNKTIEQALTSFLLSKLRVTHDQEHQNKSHLLFDIQGIDNSPLLSELPAGFRPVPLPIEKIRKQYDAQNAQATASAKVRKGSGSSQSDVPASAPDDAIIG